jgi:hypothetical protein
MTVALRNQATFVVDFVVDLVITKMYVAQGFTTTKRNSMIKGMVVMMNLSEGLLYTVQDSSSECHSRGSMRCLNV